MYGPLYGMGDVRPYYVRPFLDPALVDLSRFIVSPILTHNRVMRSSTCVSAVFGVSLVGVSLLSADVAVIVVRPEVISQRVFISRGRTRAHWKALGELIRVGQ
jgi:hypothetical protein